MPIWEYVKGRLGLYPLQIARDGADLSPSEIVDSRALTRVDVGITKDFAFTPDKPGDLVLELDLRVRGHPTRLPIRVRELSTLWSGPSDM